MSAEHRGGTPAIELYGSELLRAAERPHRQRTLRAVDHHGHELPLALERYVGQPSHEEAGVLDRAVSPVLDIGCGPGRHALALAQRGVMAVGLDIAPLAVQLARRRGAVVIQGSIFDQVPGAGSWGSALLLDGNIGIGGQPAELLARVARLLRPDGLILIEVEPRGAPSRALRVSLHTGSAQSQSFPWARLGMDGLAAIAAAAGCTIVEHWHSGDRWFAALRAAAA